MNVNEKTQNPENGCYRETTAVNEKPRDAHIVVSPEIAARSNVMGKRLERPATKTRSCINKT